MLIRKKIKYNDENMFIDFPISISDGFTGYQQEIKSFRDEKTQESINETRDGEIKRFSSSFDLYFLNFLFFNNNSNDYLNEYNTIGISYEDSFNQSDNYLNSFYIFDFFDTYKSQEQTKIYTSYLTKLNYNNFLTYFDTDEDDINRNYNVSSYWVTEYSQVRYFDIPQWYVNEQNDVFDMYLRIGFYNADNGKVIIFRNGSYSENTSSPQKLYFKVRFNKNDMKYVFLNTIDKHIDFINSYEFRLSPGYLNQINNSFENSDNFKQNYPSGKVFNFEDGQYIDNDNI